MRLCIGILVLGGLWVVAQLEGVSFQVLLQQIRNGPSTIVASNPARLCGMIFRRLLGFLRPYRGQVVASVLLAIASQICALAIPYLTGRSIDAATDGDRTLLLELAALIVAMGALKGVLMFFRRWLAGRLSLAVEFDLRNAHVHPPAAAVVRVLRPPPDRPADVPRDRRPAGGAVLPRLRPDLLHPARADGGDRADRALAAERRADADRDRHRAGADGDGLPLLADQPPHAQGGAAAGRRRDHPGRGERGRRAGGQGVRPGAARDHPLPRRLRADLPAGHQGRPAAGHATCRACRRCPAWRSPACCWSAATR